MIERTLLTLLISFSALIGLASPPDSLWRFRKPFDCNKVSESKSNNSGNVGVAMTGAGLSTNQNQLINDWADSAFTYNEKINTTSGYRLLLYAGNNRDEAYKVKEKFYKVHPELDVFVSYKLPSFKVKIGNFFRRMDALQAQSRLKAEFPNLIIIEDQVSLRPSY